MRTRQAGLRGAIDDSRTRKKASRLQPLVDDLEHGGDVDPFLKSNDACVFWEVGLGTSALLVDTQNQVRNAGVP